MLPSCSTSSRSRGFAQRVFFLSPLARLVSTPRLRLILSRMSQNRDGTPFGLPSTVHKRVSLDAHAAHTPTRLTQNSNTGSAASDTGDTTTCLLRVTRDLAAETWVQRVVDAASITVSHQISPTVSARLRRLSGPASEFASGFRSNADATRPLYRVWMQRSMRKPVLWRSTNIVRRSIPECSLSFESGARDSLDTGSNAWICGLWRLCLLCQISLPKCRGVQPTRRCRCCLGEFSVRTEPQHGIRFV